MIDPLRNAHLALRRRHMRISAGTKSNPKSPKFEHSSVKIKPNFSNQHKTKHQTAEPKNICTESNPNMFGFFPPLEPDLSLSLYEEEFESILRHFDWDAVTYKWLDGLDQENQMVLCSYLELTPVVTCLTLQAFPCIFS